jgi:hypothetical protein
LILVSFLKGWSFQAFAQPSPHQAAPQPKSAQVQPLVRWLVRLEKALVCAAAIQVAAMAAPSWAREPSASDIGNQRLGEVNAAADPYGISSYKVP